MINYRPRRASILWSLKDTRKYETVEEMKQSIAEEFTRFIRYFENTNVRIFAEDIELRSAGRHEFFGLKNCSDIFLYGKYIGYCGE